MAYPIWKDYLYSVDPSADTFNYTITDNTSPTPNILFSGKAVKSPGDGQIKVNLSNICSNYLVNEMPASAWSSNTTIWHNDAYKNFRLYSDGTLIRGVGFFWCYDRAINGDYTSLTLSNPVNGRYATGMHCFSTRMGGGCTSSHSVSGGNGYTIPACGDYAIYYLNKRGGWDSFLIEGKVVESNSYDRKYFGPFVQDNSVVGSSSKKNYLTNIQKSFEMHTSWLTDEQSRKLADNLFCSPSVYVHDLKRNQIYAGNITNADVDYKEFKNEKQLISYEINIDAANIETIK